MALHKSTFPPPTLKYSNDLRIARNVDDDVLDVLGLDSSYKAKSMCILMYCYGSLDDGNVDTICKMAYKLEFPEELSNVHSTFYVSNLKKCLSDESLVILMKELRLNDKLNFVEEPVEIMDREVKQLKQSRIPIVKVRWNYKRGPKFMWEREDQIRAKFLQLFLNKQIENLSEVNAVYDTPSHTKNVFANMRRQGRDFSGKVTPLFKTMMILQQADMGEGKPKKVTKIPQSSKPTTLVADKTLHKERGDSVERAATTATSLDAEQDSGNINRTQSTIMPNDHLPKRIGSGGRPRRQETTRDIPAQTRFESLSKQSNDLPLSRVNTLGSGEDIMKLKEFMELCTKFDGVPWTWRQQRAQAKEIAHLKMRSSRSWEAKGKSRTPGGKHSSIFEENVFDDEGFDCIMDECSRLLKKIPEHVIKYYYYEIHVTTASAPVTTAGVSVSIAEPSTPPTTTINEDEDLTIAQTLMKMKSEKSKVRGVTMQEPSETATRPTVPPQQHDLKDKGKEKMVEAEKPLKRKAQIKFDEEIAQRLQAQMQAELEEEE
ncbi:hypothetical protein Tco_0696713 [Tanacetum coccineum]